MELDQNKVIPLNDCQGTCKTPIGCTCYKANRKALAKAANTTDNVAENPSLKPSGGCACRSEGKKGGCCGGKNKLEVYNWLQDMPAGFDESQMVEVQFKNTRKGYYLNSNNIELYNGDMVAIEATPGHDIGEVTLTGKLVVLQMKKNNYRGDTKRIYRIAKPADLEKSQEAKAKEHKTMLRAREIAEELKLDMKISDVEYQGDGNKAIFYYIADERVDFRQLIKVYASEFRVKIEMKQIGARQEAGRVGGIGPCGRELCCASNMSNFVSVSTSAARLQDLPLNPQKLAGQCGKLKCCLNFEVDTYVEAQGKLPSREAILETKDGSYFHFKTDILSGMMTYSTDKFFAANLITLPRNRVSEIIKLNKRGEKPTHLVTKDDDKVEKNTSYDVLEQESITRFDSNGGNRNNRRKKVSKNRQEGNRQENSGTENSRAENKNIEIRKTENKHSENGKSENNGHENRNQNRKNNKKKNHHKPQRNERHDNTPKTAV